MNCGRVVLTPFPFTDLSGQKVRPALVVSRSGRPGSDVVLAFITSYQSQPLLPTDLLVPDTHPGFPQTGLKRNSVVKLDQLVTVETAPLLGELGDLPHDLMHQASDMLRYALEL